MILKIKNDKGGWRRLDGFYSIDDSLIEKSAIRGTKLGNAALWFESGNKLNTNAYLIEAHKFVYNNDERYVDIKTIITDRLTFILNDNGSTIDKLVEL